METGTKGEPLMKRFIRASETMLVLVLLALTALPVRAEERLRMSTTTSTENSGLLSVLLPPFEKKFGCKVDVVAVGTGKSLKLGEAGDVDVVFVHARALEDKFMANGYGAEPPGRDVQRFRPPGSQGRPGGNRKSEERSGRLPGDRGEGKPVHLPG